MNWYWWTQRLGKDHACRWRPRAEVAHTPPRPRVLLESPDGAEAHAVWSLLNRHGYDTMWCPGPSGHPARTCSLVRTGHCPLVDEADVIVNALDQNDETCADVARHLDSRADVAVHSRQVVVVAQRRAVGELAESLSHCDVVPGPLRSEMLVERVTQAKPLLMEDASTQVLPGIGN